MSVQLASTSDMVIHLVILRLAVVALAVAAAGCASAPTIVKQPPLTKVSGSGHLRAGVAETDITPPPGLPLFGHSQMAQVSRGYWTRLRCRSFVLEDPGGQRVALVQLDLGAVSGLLHRELAVRTARWGIGPAELVLLATHTHAGPGSFFGAKFYNAWGSAKPGFEPALVEYLVDRIAGLIEEAVDSLGVATVAIGSERLDGLTRNRSLRAWERNFTATEPPYANGLLSDLWAVRVDRVTAQGPRPLGALFLFPAHATAVDAANDLYHGDLHGVASIQLSREIRHLYGLDGPFVAAFAAGPEGDVSPAWRHQGQAEAIRLGNALAKAGLHLWQSLDAGGREVTLRAALIDLPVQGGSADPRLCAPVVGAATIGGAEDGRSHFVGVLGWEGRRRSQPMGCQAEKKPVLGWLQRLLIKPADFPDFAPLHAVSFSGKDLLLTVPGEPTTETARLIGEAVRSATKAQRVFVAAHGDDYLSYFATPAEYGAQHYEGSSTLYGPATEPVFADALRVLAAEMESTSISERLFHPGRPRGRFPTAACDTSAWRTLRTEAERDSTGRMQTITLAWRGMRRDQWCGQLPPARLRCVTPGGKQGVDDDTGLAFEVRRRGGDEWQATWRRPREQADLGAGGACWLEVGPIEKPWLASERIANDEAGVR